MYIITMLRTDHDLASVCDGTFIAELVWKVARYTSAGPIFFNEKDNYVDGGVLAQNPSSVGLTAIQKHYHDRGMNLPISLVVSIGSGQFPDEDMGNVDATQYLHVGKHWFHIMSELGDRIRSLTTLLSNAVSSCESFLAMPLQQYCTPYWDFKGALCKHVYVPLLVK